MTIVYYQRKEFNIKQYFINRFARVYPLYIFAIVLILFIKFFRLININELILNVTMLQSWVPNMALTLNYPGWSLSVELFFYICFPLIFKYLRNKSFNFSAVIILLFWITSQIFYQLIALDKIGIPVYSIKDVQYQPVFHLNEFLVGILTGLWFIKSSKQYTSNFTNTCLVVLLIIVLIFLLKKPIDLSYHNGLLAIIFAPLIFLISTNKGVISIFFSSKVFVYLGEISYGIYLLQYPIWKALSDYRLEKYFGITSNQSDNTLVFLLRLTVLILLAAFSFKFIESPMRNLIRKLNTTKYKRL